MAVLHPRSHHVCSAEQPAPRPEEDVGVGCQRQEPKHRTLWKKLKRGLRKPQQLDYPEGTVPYLGTVLSHLASLHKDQDSKDEYKVITLMKELQGACQELQVVPDMNFVSWLNNVKRLSELESSKLSRELEPPHRAGFLSWNNKRSPLLRKPSRNSQASSRELSSNGSSQLETCEQLSSGSGSHTPSMHWGCSPKPCAHCNPLYQSAPNICGANMRTEDLGILPFLSPRPPAELGIGLYLRLPFLQPRCLHSNHRKSHSPVPHGNALHNVPSCKCHGLPIGEGVCVGDLG
ncbi:ral guanine nucleotide dissociation stimulator-like [Dipodomys merriami]|uniref:ral guanine nucleotide dissociation stimulator-like n=1 Tax=Dipodomys merriami TaxID=94247 RepID=UPI00384ACF3C